MAYDEALAGRVRKALSGRDDVVEKKMFGGLVFMVAGHMCCGVAKEDLMLRLGETAAASALEDAKVRPMDFTGRPMKGIVLVSPEGCADARAMRRWVAKALDFVSTLPPRD